jgi:pimeloyl-ACP methyl ester carboxylesterase
MLLSAFVAAVLPGGEAGAEEGRRTKNVVLVHGAFANGSSWHKVITLLQKRGLNVTAVALPLTSFADDVAVTKRAISAQDGPTILVGHSYGGVVITETGNDPKVAGLVYVAAFAPDAGQSITDISAGFPKPIGLDKLVPQADGLLLLSKDGIETAFAQDLTKSEKGVLFAVQHPTAGSIFGAKPTVAAWRSKPAWYVVASKDNMIAPDQERTMAKQINAKTTTVPSSHVAMLTYAKEVAKVIEDAVAGAK